MSTATRIHHTASVVAYSANPWDDRLTLMIECRECGSEWGWCADKNGNSERLEFEAEKHRREAR